LTKGVRAVAPPTIDAPSILGLVPGYQEGPRIAAVVGGARAYLPIVVIDDGSTDDTAAQAEAAGATVLRQVRNAGKGAALRTGFRHALQTSAVAVVTLDADGQHDPAEIPLFLEAFEAGRPELIVGRRDFGSMPPIRRLSNTLGGWLFSAAVGRRVADNQSGYRLIGRRLMAALLESDEDGFGFEVEMIARCIALGLPMVDVPITTIYRGEPSHIRPWAHLTSFLRVSRDARRIVRGG